MHTLYVYGLCGRLASVKLPVMPPVAPMLAKPIGDIPAGQSYEPKWDGFRSIIFRDVDTAREWFQQFEGAGLDGLIAKKLVLPYQPDKRVMSKSKHERPADC